MRLLRVRYVANGWWLLWLLVSTLGCARPSHRPTATIPRRSSQGQSVENGTPPIAFEPLSSHRSKRLSIRGGIYPTGRQSVSRTCAPGDDPLWFCASDHWLAGENRSRVVSTPGNGGVLGGTDLGRSVLLSNTGRTLFYMGDSFGVLDDEACGAKHPLISCNDAVLAVDGPSSRGAAPDGVPRDLDPADGIDVAVAIGAKHRGFWPVVMDGVNGADPLPLCEDTPNEDTPCLGKFNLPTGAVAARLPKNLVPGAQNATQDEVEAVLLFYATATAVRQNAQTQQGRLRGSSFLAVSADGLHFSPVRRQPFSRDKFLIVATALLPEAIRERSCTGDPHSPLCSPTLGLEGDAVLLFGAGQPPRRSPLYLGVLRLSDLKVFYYSFDPRTGSETWLTDETAATPIFDEKNSSGQTDPQAAFGETQVTLVPKEACPPEKRDRCQDTLLLLANQGNGVFLRTAPLSRPGARSTAQPHQPSWSRPYRTSAAGYGPFVVEDFTQITTSPQGTMTLEMYHVISSWDGKGPRQLDRNPYGVFTRQLRLVNEASCHMAKDGSNIPICQDFLPPWPLELKKE